MFAIFLYWCTRSGHGSFNKSSFGNATISSSDISSELLQHISENSSVWDSLCFLSEPCRLLGDNLCSFEGLCYWNIKEMLKLLVKTPTYELIKTIVLCVDTNKVKASKWWNQKHVESGEKGNRYSEIWLIFIYHPKRKQFNCETFAALRLNVS